MTIKQKKILLADDEPAILRVYADAFKMAGFTVIEAVNGKEALRLALEEHPDYIILDIRMPEMDGLTVLERLRRDAWGKDVSIMILSNFGDSEKVQEALEHRAFEYLIKADWSTDALVEKIKARLGMK